jgi:hypothetical protein
MTFQVSYLKLEDLSELNKLEKCLVVTFLGRRYALYVSKTATSDTFVATRVSRRKKRD